MTLNLRFEWDEEKNRVNWDEHQITFSKAIEVFYDPNRISEPDNRFDYGEERLRTIGMAENMLLLVVAWTDRGNDDFEIIRIISARRARPLERRKYGNRKLQGR